MGFLTEGHYRVGMRFAALVALALTIPAVAAGATVRRVVAPGPVTALAFDGPRVAYAAGRSRYDCNRVRIWNLATSRVTALGRPFGCIETSTGTGVAAVSVAGPRVLWLYFGGGNTREWFLFTGTEKSPKARRLEFVARDVDRPPPIVIGPGDSGSSGAVLPYAVGRRVVALRGDGTRSFAWTAPNRVVALAALTRRNLELAIAWEGGSISVLDATGRVLREESYAGEIGVVRLTATGILVQRGRTLEHRDGATTWLATLPAGARLMDVAGGIDAVYAVRTEVRARRIGGTRDVLLASGALAASEGRWLATAAGRTVTARRPYVR